MPKITSPRQFRAMEAAAHGHSTIGVPAGVAEKGLAELSHAQRSRFAKAPRGKAKKHTIHLRPKRAKGY